MTTLDAAQYAQLMRGAEVLSRDEHGDKVLRTPNGRIVKLFRRKRLLSSALWRPYALRFVRAARELEARGFNTVAVEGLYRVPSIRRHAVVYPRVEGTPLRAAIQNSSRRERLVSDLASLLARLHERGVYFSAIHFGNVLVSDDQEWRLIDISETWFTNGLLSLALRARNFRPLVKYPEDAAALEAFGPRRFVEVYLAAAKLTPRDRERFNHGLRHVHPMFKARMTAG